MTKTKFKHCFVFLFAMLVVVFASISPVDAIAKDYSIDKVDINATVESDGSLHVVEDRTFDFSGEFNGVFWLIPEGSTDYAQMNVEVVSAGIVDGDTYTKFDQVSSASVGDNGVFTVSDTTNDDSQPIKKITLYQYQDYSYVVYRVEYVISNAVVAYRDTAELYWKFVSDGWDMHSEHVTCHVNLPVPADSSINTSTVKTWAHGPINGVSKIVDTGVTFTVPEVGTEEFAEARICFPVDWVPEATRVDEDKLDAILTEEQAYADETNNMRKQAIDNLKKRTALVVGITALLVILSLYCANKLKNSMKSDFTGEYFRDLPTDDHPAVLQCVMHAGDPDMNAFTASVIRLCDIGLIDLKQEVVTKGLFKKEKTVYYLEGLSEQRKANQLVSEDVSKIDVYTLETLRDIAALENAEANTLRFDEMESIAKDHPEKYSDCIEAWQTNISAIATNRGYIGIESSIAKYRGLCVSLFALIIPVLAVVAVFTLSYFEYSSWGVSKLLNSIIVIRVICIVALAATLGYLAMATSNKKGLTKSGIEIYAKLEALKKWLVDFTRLDEAIPTDVVLWNRLLVMAVALGVADKVIANLKTAAPEILKDPIFVNTYGWYFSPYYTPYTAFNHNVVSAHASAQAALTTTQVAGSSWSSGSGGGGGFSVGGGGGFGGGGGGGAF